MTDAPDKRRTVGEYTDAEIVAAISRTKAGRAFRIANALTGRTNGHGPLFLRALNRRLLKMEASKLVKRHEHYSVPNSYFWELAA